jgi:hypothetical protein
MSGGFRLTTSNRMEIIAAIKGLELLKQPVMRFRARPGGSPISRPMKPMRTSRTVMTSDPG